MKTTPLIEAHRQAGASLVPFGGWEMPVSYSDIRTEHEAVRNRAGMFDVSHMGRFWVEGPDAVSLLGKVQTTDPTSIPVGSIRYSLMLNEAAGVIDDLLVSRESDDRFLLVVNAGNRDEDWSVLQAHQAGLRVNLDDRSEGSAMVAIQGPNSPEILDALGIRGHRSLKYYTFRTLESTALGSLLVSRTGYTGEMGYEVILPANQAHRFWDRALAIGDPFGLRPAGLGARDTLRLEAGMPLFGHEMDNQTNPLEARLDFAVRSPRDYVGRAALERVRATGPARLLVGLIVQGPRIPRQGSEVVLGDRVIGSVCSGTRSPTLGCNIATALVEAADANNTAFAVRIRGNPVEAERTPLPFYKRKD